MTVAPHRSLRGSTTAQALPRRLGSPAAPRGGHFAAVTNPMLGTHPLAAVPVKRCQGPNGSPRPRAASPGAFTCPCSHKAGAPSQAPGGLPRGELRLVELGLPPHRAPAELPLRDLCPAAWGTAAVRPWAASSPTAVQSQGAFWGGSGWVPARPRSGLLVLESRGREASSQAARIFKLPKGMRFVLVFFKVWGCENVA